MPQKPLPPGEYTEPSHLLSCHSLPGITSLPPSDLLPEPQATEKINIAFLTFQSVQQGGLRGGEMASLWVPSKS